MGLLSSLKRKSAEPAGRRLPPQDPAQVELLRTRARRRLIGVAVLVGVAVVALPYVFEATPRPAPPELSVRMPGEPAEVLVDEATSAGQTAVPTAMAASLPTMGAASAASAVGTGASASPLLAAGTGVAVAGVAAAAGMALAKAPRDDIITEPKDPQAEQRERDRQKAAADKAAAEKVEKARQERLRAERVAREKAEREKAEREKAEKAEKAE
ncbi:MAG: hypothetical protein RLZZ592_1857, partial [Pseudomonadota bacterium]